MFALAALLACSEYDFGGDPRLYGLGDTGAGGATGEGEALGFDTGGGDDPADDDPLDTDGCSDGYVAYFYNLPEDHPDVEQGVTGIVPGDDPSRHDWWDPRYFSRQEVNPGLEFGSQWWPVDDGLPGDPQYFAVRWEAVLQVDADGPVSFELGSDDDGWAYLDGVQVADLGGIHGVEATSFTVPMTAGLHALDLYMAERHTSDAGFWFRWTTPGVRIYACPR